MFLFDIILLEFCKLNYFLFHFHIFVITLKYSPVESSDFKMTCWSTNVYFCLPCVILHHNIWIYCIYCFYLYCIFLTNQFSLTYFLLSFSFDEVWATTLALNSESEWMWCRSFAHFENVSVVFLLQNISPARQNQQRSSSVRLWSSLKIWIQSDLPAPRRPSELWGEPAQLQTSSRPPPLSSGPSGAQQVSRGDIPNSFILEISSSFVCLSPHRLSRLRRPVCLLRSSSSAHQEDGRHHELRRFLHSSRSSSSLRPRPQRSSPGAPPLPSLQGGGNQLLPPEGALLAPDVSLKKQK